MKLSSKRNISRFSDKSDVPRHFEERSLMSFFTLAKDFGKSHLRNGRLFDKYLAELEQVEKYSSSELKQYQEKKLKRTVHIRQELMGLWLK
jgi:hypothetical protein